MKIDRRELLATPSLWLIMAAAGTTNTFFNWGVSTGDVVRVVLLFYLSPIWASLLERLVMKTPLSPETKGEPTPPAMLKPSPSDDCGCIKC